MVASKFRKKPVVIEAMQFDGLKASAEAICAWANWGENAREDGDPNVDYTYMTGDPAEVIDDMLCNTLEGVLNVSPGDWIIRGVSGEFYPCKPDVFALTYEPVEPVEPACSECGGAGKRLSTNFDGDPFVPCPACAVPESPGER